jgi:hypothetical protein
MKIVLKETQALVELLGEEGKIGPMNLGRQRI